METTSSSGRGHIPQEDSPTVPDRLLRAAQVAEALGVSVRQVWKLRAQGSLPAPIKVGNSTRWRASEIQRWIRGERSGGSE